MSFFFFFFFKESKEYLETILLVSSYKFRVRKKFRGNLSWSEDAVFPPGGI